VVAGTELGVTTVVVVVLVVVVVGGISRTGLYPSSSFRNGRSVRSMGTPHAEINPARATVPPASFQARCWRRWRVVECNVELVVIIQVDRILVDRIQVDGINRWRREIMRGTPEGKR
jgi:hypothetical protein